MRWIDVKIWIGEIEEGSYISNLVNPLPEFWESEKTYLMGNDRRSVEEIYKSIKSTFDAETKNLLNKNFEIKKGFLTYRGSPSSIDVRIMKKIEGNEELEKLRQEIVEEGKKHGIRRESEDYPGSIYWNLTYNKRKEFTNLLFDPSNLHITNETIVHVNVNTPLGVEYEASLNLMNKIRRYLKGYKYVKYPPFSHLWNSRIIQPEERVCDYPYEIWAGKKVERDNFHVCGKRLSELEEEAKKNGIDLRKIPCKFSSTGYCNEDCLPKGGVSIKSLPPPQGISTTSWMEKRDNLEEIHEIFYNRGKKIHRVYVKKPKSMELIREEEIHE